MPLVARMLLRVASDAGVTGDDAVDVGREQGHDAARIWRGTAPGRALLGELTRLGFDPDPSAVAFHDLLADRQADARPGIIFARVEALEDDVRAATGLDPNRVGALYAAIYWLLQPSDDPFGPEPFTVEDGFRRGWHVRETDFRRAEEITTFATTIALIAGVSGPGPNE